MLEWPLGHRDASEAAWETCGPLSEFPKVQDQMFKALSSRFIGAKNIEDMARILKEVSAEIRETLPC